MSKRKRRPKNKPKPKKEIKVEPEETTEYFGDVKALPRKDKIVLLVAMLLLTVEIGIALYVRYDQQETGIYIEEVFDYYHYVAEGENRTRLWTVGYPGKFALRGTHNFTIGYGYWIEGKEVRRNFMDPDAIYPEPRPYDFRGYPIPEFEELMRELSVERRVPIPRRYLREMQK